jgi:threo-3-hydroxy-L-aspartate ammonia-lyase
VSGQWEAPTYGDVAAARDRLAGHAHQTPVVTSSRLAAQSGAEVVFFKCESLQRSGSFKFRGAYNAISQFTDEQRRAGVLAYSSGNHAQAIGLAARMLDVPAVVIMPDDAPAVKVDATLGYGAEVVRYDRYAEDREEIGARLALERGMTLVPPYDHPHVIAGQGTATAELHEAVGQLDVLVVPVGGGGLLAGACLATRALAPQCEIYGVEPEAGDDGRQSLRRGRIVHIDTPTTIADGAQTQHLGTWTFPIIQRDVTDILTVTDDELVAAIRTLAGTMKLLVEPTGCLGFAALPKLSLTGKRVGVLLSGGNVDLVRYGRLLVGDAR